MDARDPASLLVEDDADQAAIEKRDRRQRHAPEREHHPQVVAGHREDRSEEVLEQAYVESVRARDEHDAERDPGVEDDRQRLITGRAAARAEPFDRERSHHGEAERGEDRRHAEQVPGGDSRERDVPETVAHQRLSPLDEEEADRGREDADDRSDGEGEAHELELEHPAPQ